MPDICVATTLADCDSHAQTGSSKVTADGKGVCRVETDTAVGLIIGPGSQNVFVEGDKVSLPGDAITTHGKSPHSSPVTVAGQSKVTAGTGFAGDAESTGDAPKPDLETESYTASISLLHCSGQGHYPPTNMQAAINFCYTGTGTPPPAPPSSIGSISRNNNSRTRANTHGCRSISSSTSSSPYIVQAVSLL